MTNLSKLSFLILINLIVLSPSFSQRYFQPKPLDFSLSKPPVDFLEVMRIRQEREEAVRLEAYKAMYRGRIHIYGGVRGHDTYLGCLTCPSADPLSVWSPSGSYGINGRLLMENIWNIYSIYGERYGNYSPWSFSATNPPVAVDFDGNFYGYVTANPHKDLRTNIKFFLALVNDYGATLNKYYDIGNMIR